jgi:hypothetical protein
MEKSGRARASDSAHLCRRRDWMAHVGCLSLIVLDDFPLQEFS